MSGWLLLRGLAREQGHWERFPKLLMDRTKEPVVLLDLPGVGLARDRDAPRTIKDTVFDLRRRWLELPERPDRILGLSMGGMVALDWASRFDQDWKTVLAVNASAQEAGLPTRRLRLRGLARLARASLAKDPVERELAVLRVTSHRRAGDRALAARWAGVARERPLRPDVVMAQLMASARFRCPQRRPTSVTVVAGLRDQLVHPKCSRQLAETLSAPLEEHPDAGHDLPLDQPEWMADRAAECMG
ncbi:MAG: alpha/beta fold hydrolase [Myxococcota bacterium]